MLLTSHLEHELTVDDLPDETQVQLELSMRGGTLLSKPNHSLKFKSRLFFWSDFWYEDPHPDCHCGDTYVLGYIGYM